MWIVGQTHGFVLQSCQYWLSESRKTSSAMDAMVEQRVLKLVKGLWPATTLEGWTGFPAEVRGHSTTPDVLPLFPAWFYLLSEIYAML